MHLGTCVTHVPWCMSGSLTRVDVENIPGILGACATRNFTYLARGPWRGSILHTNKWVMSLCGMHKAGTVPCVLISQVKIILGRVCTPWLGFGLLIQTFRLVTTKTERSSGWRPCCSLETFKLVFNVASDYQGCHPDDLFVCVTSMVGTVRVVTVQLVLSSGCRLNEVFSRNDWFVSESVVYYKSMCSWCFLDLQCRKIFYRRGTKFLTICSDTPQYFKINNILPRNNGCVQMGPTLYSVDLVQSTSIGLMIKFITTNNVA